MRLKFKCTLLSDIIMNQKAASEGPNETLDFIPGNNFLGIVASKYYKDPNMDPIMALNLFHKNTVCFGDAHFGIGNHRTHKVPADLYQPKLEKDKFFIYHEIDFTNDNVKEDMLNYQLKQCREGFYDFMQTPAMKVEPEKNFAIKSAHDRNNRTSEKNKMYGYQSLEKGQVLFFEVLINETGDSALDEALGNIVKENLNGTHGIGRSRSAQFGSVKIETADYEEINSAPSKGNICTVYADSRLIFLNEMGTPTFQPTADDLGIKGGKILWDKSQVRIFQYSPWNAKRQCFDADRCGIEKGSVIIVEEGTCPATSAYIGNFNNEGFGKVIYNPSFLSAKDNYGTACQALAKPEPEETEHGEVTASTPLIHYLLQRKQEEAELSNIIKTVNDTVDKWIKTDLFSKALFASQWGTIRSMASQQAELPIETRLFAKETGYLKHGKAAAKWELRKRCKELQGFMAVFNDKPEAIKRLALINLAAEMAKVCRKEEK